jgi:hypothetical protein
VDWGGLMPLSDVILELGVGKNAARLLRRAASFHPYLSYFSFA